ncbi:MAG: MMPL family transporter [Salinivirgaceae bacterium]|jgi:predicted RND superfamily exporter protein|nr:MMPL family transporter [Salinivirgaceae bacterium]
MENILNRLLKYKWLSMIIIVAISVFFIFEMKENTTMETNLDKYMPQDHPAFIYSDKAESWFGINDGIIIAVENKNGIYNTETLDTLKQLTKRFQDFDEIEKDNVTSLYNADNIVGTEDGMDVKRFFKSVPKTKEKLSELKESVRKNEMVFGRLVSENEQVTVIIAEIGDGVFTPEFYDEILESAKLSETEDIKIHVAGRPIVEGEMALLGPADMKKMVPIVILVILVVLFLTLRSIKGTLITLGVVFLSTIWAFGLMASVGIPIYAVSTMIPVMLIAIGVADGIHLYSHLHTFVDHHPTATKLEATKDMIKHLWKPVAMTSITTAVGFISLLTSEVYPVKYFGIFTAFGVLMAMVFSLVFLPAGIMIFGLPKAKPVKHDEDKEGHSHSKLANAFAASVIKHKYVSIIGAALIIVVSIVGMQKLWINSSFLDKFEKDSDIVLTDKFINENFGGTSSLNLILDSDGKKGVFKEPVVLKLVDKMQKDVNTQLQVVGNTFSLADYMNRMNKVMNADREEFNTIPDSKNMIAQYLLLYEMSGDPENLNKVVDYNYEKLNVTFQLKKDDSKSINAALDIIQSYESNFKDLGISMNYAGSGYKGLVFTDLILEGQIKSLILSLLIIIVLLSLMFKNIKIGLISAVPIILTAAISFGIMGFLNIPLSTTTALLSSIAIGIGIDYAVHFLEQYRTNAAKSDDKIKVAQLTMAHSGKAIIFNAVVVIAGFLVLLFSVFPPNRELGALVSLNMFTSFVGTLTIMLVLLYTSNLYFKRK